MGDVSEDKGETKTNNHVGKFKVKSGYGTALGLSSFVSVVGWIAVVGGVLLVLNGLSSGVPASLFFQAVIGIGITVGGLLLVMVAQLTRAIIDTADYSREMLKVMVGIKASAGTTDAEVDGLAKEEGKWTWF